MKKALSLVMALTLSAALSIPAFATAVQYYPGRDQTAGVPNVNPATLLYNITQRADMGPVDWFDSDASIVIGPAIANTVPAAYYIVEWGDDLQGIAYSFYGQPSLAQALYDANKDGHFLATGGMLQANTPLRIPDELNGVKRLDNPILWTDANGVNHTYSLVGGANGGITEVPEGIIYQVESGDTLAKIVATFYSGRTDSFIINRIVARNMDLSNANSLKVGQYLILPNINIGL